MLPLFAIFEFQTDKSIAIGRTEWIPDIYEAGINTVEEFDFEASCEVLWPDNASAILKSKSGKVPDKKGNKSYETMVLAFGDSVESLQKKLVELEKSGSTATTSGRSTTKPKRFLQTSDDDDVEAGTEEVANPQKKKVKALKNSEKKTSQSIVDMICAKRSMTKDSDDLDLDHATANRDKYSDCSPMDMVLQSLERISRKLDQIDNKLTASKFSPRKSLYSSTVSRGIFQHRSPVSTSVPARSAESVHNSFNSPSSVESPVQTPFSSRRLASTDMQRHVDSPVSSLHVESIQPRSTTYGDRSLLSPGTLAATETLPQNDQMNNSTGGSQEEDIIWLNSTLCIKQHLLKRINHDRPERLTTELMSCVWSREYMGTHTLTGKYKSNDKEPLDPSILFGIQSYVESKFPSFSSKDFRNAVKIKLNNEDKRMRNQAIKYYARVVIIFINDIKDNMGP